MINWFKGLQHPEAFHGKDSSLLILKGGIISWFPRQKGQSLSFLACIEVEKIKMNLHLS